VKRLPGTVRHSGQVGDDDMDMTLRIERTARFMREQSVDKITCLDWFARFGALICPALGKLALDPAHRLLDRAPVRIEDALIARYQREDAGRLWHRECKVQTGLPVVHLADLLTIGQLSIEDLFEGILGDFARESEQLCPLSFPTCFFRAMRTAGLCASTAGSVAFA